MNATAPNAFGSLINIFFEPRKTLQDIRNHTSWLWYPVLLVIAINLLFQIWYANRVDIAWFADQTLAPSADKMTADQLRDAHARFTPNSMIVFGSIATVFVFLWYLIQALYFFMAAKIGGWQQQGYGAWLNFISWTSMPALLGFAASAAYMLSTSSRQISPVDLDITSLDTLLFHIPYAAKGQALASSLRLTTIWSWVLMVIGISGWTGKSMVKAALTVLTPYAIGYAVWIAWVLIRA